MPKKGTKLSEETKKKIGEGNKGKRRSEETRRKIGDANRGKKRSEETRRKMSEVNKGKPKSEEHKRKLRESRKGKPCNHIKDCDCGFCKVKRGGNKGIKLPPRTEETKQKIRESRIGKPHKHKQDCNCLFCKTKRGEYKPSEEIKRKIGESNKGKKRTEEHKNRYSESKKGRNHPNWQNGKSFEPYGLEFNEDLKEAIRSRDNRKCQICNKSEVDEGRKLSVHHIDYDKRNNDPKNLITLCLLCHQKTNFDRDYWVRYFLRKTSQSAGNLV